MIDFLSFPVVQDYVTVVSERNGMPAGFASRLGTHE